MSSSFGTIKFFFLVFFFKLTSLPMRQLTVRSSLRSPSPINVDVETCIPFDWILIR